MGGIMGFLLIVLAIAVLILIFAVSVYNRLVKLRTHVEEGWSGINVQLKKRHDLIPNLLNTVKGYAAHERETFERVTQARVSAMQANDLKSLEAAENELSSALGRLFAVAESYPELKANENFMHLQEQLSVIESDVEKSRRYYNGTVRNKNIAIDSFPSNIIANMFGFTKSDFFELENEAERAVPQISF